MQTCESVSEVIAAHRRLRGPRTRTYYGHTFWEMPGVFSPFIAPSGCLEFAFAAWPMFEGAAVLDVGSGSGIPSCLFALNGARHVLGVDINTAAIEAGQRNASASHVDDRVSFVHGDLFQPVLQSNFDIIFADLPFMAGEPVDSVDRAFFDPSLHLITRYLEGLADRRVVQQGTLSFLCVSDLSGTELSSVARGLGLQWHRVMAIDRQWVELSLIQLSGRLP